MDSDASLKQINKSGYPFQLKIVDEINKTTGDHGWFVSSQEHAWINENGTSSGFIDVVLAHNRIPTPRMVVECKRIKADDGRQLRWAFLLPENPSHPSKVATCFELEGRGGRTESQAYQWEDLRVWDNVRLTPESLESQFCILTSDESSRQPLLERLSAEVIESVEGLAQEEIRLTKSQKGTHLRLFIFAAIVTNAELVTCSFDPTNVNLVDGTIDIKNVELTTVPFIRFRKSLATEFPKGEFGHLSYANKAREKTIFIVNGSRLPQFLSGWEFGPLYNHGYAVQRLMDARSMS